MKEAITLVGGKAFKPFLDEHVISLAVQQIASKINKDYKGQRPVILSLLNGAFMFTSDLMKHLTIECQVYFIKATSYQGTEQKQITFNKPEGLGDRQVIIVEDIIDSGNTVEALIKYLWLNGAPDFRIASLLYKPKAFKHDYKIDYVGIEISNEFVVGYGMDYNEYGRNLPEILQEASTNEGGSAGNITGVSITGRGFELDKWKK